MASHGCTKAVAWCSWWRLEYFPNDWISSEYDMSMIYNVWMVNFRMIESRSLIFLLGYQRRKVETFFDFMRIMRVNEEKTKLSTYLTWTTKFKRHFSQQRNLVLKKWWRPFLSKILCTSTFIWNIFWFHAYYASEWTKNKIICIFNLNY